MYDLGLKNEKAKDEFFQNARQLDESVASSDYEATVNSLDAPGFLEYYRYIGQFAGCYKIANWKDYNDYEPIQIEQLNQELVKHEKTEEKLELVDSFHEEELQSEKFSDNIKGIQDLNLFEDNVLNETRLDEIFKIYENTFGIDAVEALPDSLKILRKRISNIFGTNPLFTGNYHTTTIDGDVGVREYIIKRGGSDWNNEKLRKEGFTIYETKILTGEKE